MGRPRVAIVRGGDPREMVRRSLDLIDAKKLFSDEDKVLIKPNYVAAKPPSSGITTDSRLVEVLIEFVRECGVEDVKVADGGAEDTEKVFDIVEVRDVAIRQGVELVDLNRDRLVKVPIPGALALKEVGVAETVLNSNCIVNVPKLKVHSMARVSLSMKNLMGAILPKKIMHFCLDEKIADLASLITPRINVIDGLVGSEIDEIYGKPVRMDLIIAGVDIVATDTIGAVVMGLDPRRVNHIPLAEEKGLGIGDPSRIKVLGEEAEAVKKRFKLPRMID